MAEWITLDSHGLLDSITTITKEIKGKVLDTLSDTDKGGSFDWMSLSLGLSLGWCSVFGNDRSRGETGNGRRFI